MNTAAWVLVLGCCIGLGVLLERWPGIRLRPLLPLPATGAHLALASSIYLLVMAVPSPDPYRLSGADLVDPIGLCVRIIADDAQGPSPGSRILARVAPDVRSLIHRAASTGRIDAEECGRLASGLDAILDDPDLYRPADFAAVPLRPAFREVLEGPVESQAVPMHRLLLEASFPQAIRPCLERTFGFLLLRTSLLAIAVPILLRTVLGVRYGQLGLRAGRRGTNLVYGGLQAVVWGPGVMLASGLARSWIPQEAPHPGQWLLSALPGGKALGLCLVVVVLVGPFWEELFFRGILQAWLCRSLARVGRLRPFAAGLAIGITAICFGGAHAATWPDPLPLAILALGLGLTYQRTGSLWAPLAQHAVFNAANVVLGLWQ